MRGADPAIVLVPGVGMFSFGKDKQTARVAGEFYVNAINVMRGAEAVSTYAPIEESEKFRIEYWALEEAKLRRMPKPRPLATRVALVTGAGSGIGKAIAHAAGRRGRVRGGRGPRTGRTPRQVAEELGGPDKAVAVTVDVTSEEQIVDAFGAAVLAFGGVDLVVNNAGISISKPLLETTAQDWDLQHDIMARGSFLVSREAARVMIAQGLGGDIVYIASKNAVFAGPNNIAYSATKADQAHQVRLLAAELGEHGIRVNGVNPDGVVRGSGIFAGGWGAQRAATYGDRGGEARRVLRPADHPQARGTARARRQRGVRPDRRGPHAHDGAAHTGRRRRRRGVPAMSAPWRRFPPGGRVRRGRPGRLQRARHGRPGRPRHPGPGGGPPLPQPSGATSGGAALGRARPVRGRAGRAARRRRHGGRRSTSVGIDSWAVDYGLLDADGALLGNPVHYRDGRTEGVAEKVWATRAGGGAVRGDGLAVRAVQHPLPARGGPGIRPTCRCAAAVADPRSALVLADRRAGHGADQRLDHPADRPAHRATGRTTVAERLGHRPRALPAAAAARGPGGAVAAGGAGGDRADAVRFR